MRLIYYFTHCLILLFYLINSNSAQDNFQSNFYDEIESVTKDMKISPLDMLAKDNPLAKHHVNRHWIQINAKRERLGMTRISPLDERRLKTNSDTLQKFYKFCDLSLQSTTEDIEECLARIKTAPIKQQAVLLVVLYIHCFPQRIVDELNGRIEIIDLWDEWSWEQWGNGSLVLKAPNQVISNEFKMKCKKVISEFRRNEYIVFPHPKNLKAVPFYYRRGPKRSDNTLDAEDRWCIICMEHVDFNVINPPPEHDWILDFILHNVPFNEHHRLEWAQPYLKGMVRVEVKYRSRTIGQIATRLLESWDTPQSESVMPPDILDLLGPLHLLEKWDMPEEDEDD